MRDGRTAKDDAGRAALGKLLGAEWIKLLNDVGVPCGPIYKINESFADPQVQHLEMAQPAAALGDLTILGHPVSFGDKRLPLQNAAPALGEHNEEILTSLGYTREQMSIGKIKPLFTPSHLPASAHPLPPCSRWGPIWSASTYMSHSYQGLIYCAPVKIAATPPATASPLPGSAPAQDQCLMPRAQGDFPTPRSC